MEPEENYVSYVVIVKMCPRSHAWITIMWVMICQGKNRSQINGPFTLSPLTFAIDVMTLDIGSHL